MKSDDVEVLGSLFARLGETRMRIEPHLPIREHLDFMKRYTERCFFFPDWQSGPVLKVERQTGVSVPHVRGLFLP